VLFEKPGRRAGQAIGRSPYLQAVYAEDAAHLIGKIAKVRIEEAMPNSLRGSLVEARSREKALAN
jgi:tRNA-2-methylthio-N6-dimethylallyladenosine synthase